MASITTFLFWRHLRAEPNQFILHYRNGKVVRTGPGLMYWFFPLSASVAEVPVEDCETTFVLNERTSDYQDLAVQCTLRYRISNPEKAAQRTNFTISLTSGSWVEQPLDRLAALWSQRTQTPTRHYLTSVPVMEAVSKGPLVIREAIEKALSEDAEIAAMGLNLVAVEINQVAPTPEVAKAIQTPTREAIQQKADEAVFSRRALAVEKERAIKENELSTQIELARREEDLIRKKSENDLLGVQGEILAAKTRIEGEATQQQIQAEAHARDVKTKALGDAEARRILDEAVAIGERVRFDMYGGVKGPAAMALTLQAFARHLQSIQHLNITPDMLTQSLQQFLRDQADK